MLFRLRLTMQAAYYLISYLTNTMRTMAPSSEEGQQTYSQPILQAFENNASMEPPKSPPFWLFGLLESTDFQPYSGPSDGAWQSPAGQVNGLSYIRS